MAKKQSSKKTTIKKTGGLSVFWNKHWQVILISVLVIGILGFIGVNKLIIYNQKQQFDQAEKSLDTLYANIVKDVGQPTSMAKDKSCSYASTEGGKGRRGCGTSYKIVYNSGSVNEANSLKQSVIELAAKELDVKYSRDATFVAGNDSTPGEEAAIDFICPGVITCSLTVSYSEFSNDSNKSGSYHSKTIIEFAAGGDAKAEFYPVKN